MSAIRVIQFTDPHLFGNPAETLRGVNTFETLERTLADASGHISIADAVLVTGDLVQDDSGGYEHFRRLFARLGKPVLCIPGNHDLVPEMRAALAEAPFELDGIDFELAPPGTLLVDADDTTPPQPPDTSHLHLQ